MNGKVAKKPTVADVNVLYLLTVLLFFTIGGIIQQRNIYFGLLVTEFGIILLPTLIYIYSRKMDIKYVIRLKSVSWYQVILIILIALSSYGLVAFLSLLWTYLLDLIGELLPQPFPIIETGKDYVEALAVIAGSAAISEEFFFRGVVLRGYEVYGARKAVIYSGFLFGLMHANIQNLIGPILLGMIIGFLVYTTDSILSGMIAHFVNNAIAVTLAYISAGVAKMLDESMTAQSLVELPPYQLWMTIMAWGLLGMISLMLLIWFLYLLKKTSAIKVKTEDLTASAPKPRFVYFIPLIVAIILIVAEMVVQLMMIMGIIPIS